MAKQLHSGPAWIRKGKTRRPWGFRFRGRKAQVGRWGEWLALKHLRMLGWDILARNWRSRRGELDLVAFDGPQLVIVEVRTRWVEAHPAPDRTRPEETVGREKSRRLDALAWDFARRYDLTGESWRVDLIAVETPDLRRFELRHYIL